MQSHYDSFELFTGKQRSLTSAEADRCRASSTRAGVPHAQLLHFYLAVIRPVLEYAAPVWHHSLNKSRKNQIEAIQKRQYESYL